MTERELYAAIDMPQEAIARLNETDLTAYANAVEEYAATVFDDFERAEENLRAALGEDIGGWKILKTMLRTALRTLEVYRERGMSEQIFVDTMSCFSRFVREHKESFGEYGFDRAFWMGRQLSCRIFRLGTLEYEYSQDEDGGKIISVHIPSNADLSAQSIENSLSRSKEFLARFGGEYANAKYACFSWLLAPALKEVLPQQSKILYFQSLFDIKEVYEDNDGYKLWVFKNSALQPEDFPENTSLQRNLKKYVLAGGKVGEAYGILKMYQ